MDYYLLGQGGGGGWEVGNVQNKNSSTANTAEKKMCEGNHGEKNQASALYYSGPVFDSK